MTSLLGTAFAFDVVWIEKDDGHCKLAFFSRIEPPMAMDLVYRDGAVTSQMAIDLVTAGQAMDLLQDTEARRVEGPV